MDEKQQDQVVDFSKQKEDYKYIVGIFLTPTTLWCGLSQVCPIVSETVIAMENAIVTSSSFPIGRKLFQRYCE